MPAPTGESPSPFRPTTGLGRSTARSSRSPGTGSTSSSSTSRPIPQTPWRYRFDAVVNGHPLDPIVSETLAEVRRQAQRFTVFGSYPA